jgi:hypothetical protein
MAGLAAGTANRNIISYKYTKTPPTAQASEALALRAYRSGVKMSGLVYVSGRKRLQRGLDFRLLLRGKAVDQEARLACAGVLGNILFRESVVEHELTRGQSGEKCFLTARSPEHCCAAAGLRLDLGLQSLHDVAEVLIWDDDLLVRVLRHGTPSCCCSQQQRSTTLTSMFYNKKSKIAIRL